MGKRTMSLREKEFELLSKYPVKQAAYLCTININNRRKKVYQ